MFGIQGKKKADKRFRPFDYANGIFVSNVIHQTLWENRDYVEILVVQMNVQNPDHVFKVIER